MSAWKSLPEVINGFLVIKDLGFFQPETAKQAYRICIAECKICLSHFNVRVRDLKKRVGCHCNKTITVKMRTPKRLQQIRKDMIKRCYNPNNIAYDRYGGRGITVCYDWLQYSHKFYKWAFENGYKDNLTIDRIDNDKGYSPENCRWATYAEQNMNKREK